MKTDAWVIAFNSQMCPPVFDLKLKIALSTEHRGKRINREGETRKNNLNNDFKIVDTIPHFMPASALSCRVSYFHYKKPLYL